VAIKGCIGVFHVATPLPQDFGNGEAEEVVIQGAADGTLGILKACLNSKTVKRVVYTSSASAVAFNDSGVEMMDGSYWSNVDYTELIFKKQFKKIIFKKNLCGLGRAKHPISTPDQQELLQQSWAKSLLQYH
jgi:hypothetical protein